MRSNSQRSGSSGNCKSAEVRGEAVGRGWAGIGQPFSFVCRREDGLGWLSVPFLPFWSHNPRMDQVQEPADKSLAAFSPGRLGAAPAGGKMSGMWLPAPLAADFPAGCSRAQRQLPFLAT